MRLKLLTIKNFRAINGGKNKIHFGKNNIVFIFGKNNIGKSSVLHAYRYFASPNQKAIITDFFDQRTENNIVIEATFEKEQSDNENFEKKGLNKWVSENGEIKFRKTWASVDGTAKKETFSLEEDRFVDGGFGGLEPILTSATPNIIYIEAIPSIKSLTDWLEKEIKSRLLKKLKENHEKEYEAALTAIKTLQDKVEGDESFINGLSQSANKYFSQTFPDFQLNIRSTPHKEVDPSKAFEKDFSVTIGSRSFDTSENSSEENHLKNAVENLKKIVSESETSNNESLDRTFDLHGHGLIRQTIINILGIFKDSKEDEKHIILFEEPELYLHPSNKRRFRETLYKIAEQDQYQIICVSHDPQLIDLSREHTSLARFVKDENGETAIHQAGDDLFSRDIETKERMLMLNRFNPHICETFFSDEVVLVEGDTEAIVLRELLSKNYPEKDVFILNTGTKNNIPFFIEALSHFKIKQHVIHDSDERFLYDNGVRQLKKDNTPKCNSAWTLNEAIWDELQKAKNNGVVIRRYVSIRNFEHSHNYQHDPQKGKPLSAYEYAKSLDIKNNTVNIISFIKQIVGDLEYTNEFTQEYLEESVVEPF